MAQLAAEAQRLGLAEHAGLVELQLPEPVEEARELDHLRVGAPAAAEDAAAAFAPDEMPTSRPSRDARSRAAASASSAETASARVPPATDSG